jgi:CRP-like cAMP-binding protein
METLQARFGPDRLVDFVSQVPLFLDIAAEPLASLTAACRLDTFGPPGDIFRQGDPADRVWIVVDGQVKIVRSDETGREAILEVLSKGEAFGGAVIFLPEHPATARPLTDTATTVSLPRFAYERALRESPDAALRIIHMLGHRLHSSIRMNQLAGERVERRLAYILLKMGRVCGRPGPEGIALRVSLSRQDLADMAGTTLETAIRILSRFRKDGLVETRRGGYLLLRNEGGLKKIARS